MNGTYGRIRHYCALCSPSAMAGLRAVAERDRRLRAERLLAAARDRVGQRLRQSRPRMRALRVAPGGAIRFEGVAAPPSPGPWGAIVRPIASSTCDLDCSIMRGASSFALPLHLGHECVAEVIGVGESVADVKPGDRVIVPFQISCGSCPPCRQGRTANCLSVPPASMYGMGVAAGHWGGAFSDQLAVPYADAMLVPLPAGVDPVAAASVSDNICDAYRHIAPHLPQMLERDPDSEVLVLAGVGRRPPFSASLPLYVGLIARAHGARHVHIADSRASVREHAERLALNALRPRELRQLPLSPLVVDASGSNLALALSRTAPDGVCTSSGSFHRSARIPTVQMYVRNVTLHFGRVHVRPLIPKALDLIQAGKLRPETVTTSVAALDDAPRALREHCRDGGVKTVLTA